MGDTLLSWARTAARRIGHDLAANHGGPPIDRLTVTVFAASALLLCVFAYFGAASAFYRLGLDRSVMAWRPDLPEADLRLLAYGYWGAQSLILRVLAPVLVITLVLRERPSAFGLGLGETRKHLGLYVALYAFMAPLLALASTTAGFQATYPFYKPALEGGARFWVYEAAYLAQFFGVEAFFRGFLLFGLARRFGYYAILIMTIPYMMIHFGKPIGETIGAVGAGCVLGYLALKTRSVAPGVFVDCGVAFTMDFLMLGRAAGGLVPALGD